MSLVRCSVILEAVLYDVYILSVDGTREYVFKSVDLDYFNIRQWRLALFHLSKDIINHSRLVIEPINNDPFTELSSSCQST